MTPKIPPPLPDEDELDQIDRREEQRFTAPLIFGPLAGAAVGGLLLLALTAFGVKLIEWLKDVVLYGFMLIVGPLVVYRLTRARPDWVETGLVDDRDDTSRHGDGPSSY